MAGSPLLVVALGGNAISPRGVEHTENVWETVRSAARAILEAKLRGYNVVVTHGNGPQVGYLMEAIDLLPPERPRQTLDLIVAMTQGWLGYLISHAITLEARRLGVKVDAVSITTRVIVDPEDPAFSNPSKPVGFYYTREEAERLARERGWTLKPDPRGGYRRVVPSPRPLDILEHRVISRLARDGVIVVAAGGGGIPIARGTLRPLEAVVDKDLASSLLARLIGADRFIILTDVKGVAINYRKPGETWLTRTRASVLERYLAEGHFPPGSMGPKVEAALEFVKSTGRHAAIGHLSEALDVMELRTGTVVEPG